MAPQALDAFCCAGGATRGYQLAGFSWVEGVDIFPQPHYIGDVFHLAEAVEFIKLYGYKYDFIHASPPCQLYSDTHRIKRANDHPDLIGPTRGALNATGRAWVIENVESALPELFNPVLLCGAMFELRTYR